MARRWGLVGGALFVATLGCASAPLPPLSTERALAIFDDVMRARCERAVRCGASHDEYPDYPYPPSVCVDRVRLRDLVALGQRAVDGDAAATCLSALAASPPCRGPHLVDADHFATLDPGAIACERSVVDTGVRVCAGERCAPYDDCIADPSCGTHCGHHPGLGEPCVQYTSCRDGLVCDGATHQCVTLCDPFACAADAPNTRCYRNRCVAVLVAGAACDPTNGGAPCESGTRCRDDLGRCAAVRPTGSDCDPATDACASGLPCDETTRRCEPPMTGARSCVTAEACGPGQVCMWAELAGDCVDGVAFGICASISDGLTTRDDCADGLQCITGLSSIVGGAVCDFVARDGEACDGRVECEDGTRCTGGVCRETVLPWEPCSADALCTPGYTCIDGACTTPFARVGEQCEHDGDCREGVCRNGRCAYLLPGAPCPRGSECPACESGTCGADLAAGLGEGCAGVVCSPWLSCQPAGPGTTDPLGYCCP